MGIHAWNQRVHRFSWQNKQNHDRYTRCSHRNVTPNPTPHCTHILLQALAHAFKLFRAHMGPNILDVRCDTAAVRSNLIAPCVSPSVCCNRSCLRHRKKPATVPALHKPLWPLYMRLRTEWVSEEAAWLVSSGARHTSNHMLKNAMIDFPLVHWSVVVHGPFRAGNSCQQSKSLVSLYCSHRRSL